ncbi:50S ribosomal protein L25 [Patescibacteria group bacterium]
MPILKAKTRDVIGRKVKNLREQEMVPAVLYGPKMKESQHLSVSIRELQKILRDVSESTILDLEIEDGKKTNVLIHDVAYDSVKDIPIHIDFYEVDMTKPIIANVELVFTGESEVIKSQGGVLIKVIHEVEVEALPKDLPEEFNIDISKLKTFEDRILISDISLPPGVKIESDPEGVVALAEPPRVEEEVEEKPAEADLENIEVEARGKKEEEGDVTEEKTEKAEKGSGEKEK